jgi:hypothetical protein
MQIYIYIYSCFLIIIKSFVVKVVELFLFLDGFATEKWLFWWVSYIIISGLQLAFRSHLLAPTVSEASRELLDFEGAAVEERKRAR